MARPGPETQAKRRREQAKREKRRAKDEKKALRKAQKSPDYQAPEEAAETTADTPAEPSVLKIPPSV